MTKSKVANRNCNSYGLKHTVENPSGRFGTEQRPESYTVYTYEGTFILAALETGFTFAQADRGLTGWFNMTTGSIKDTARRLAAPSAPVPA